MDAEKCFLIRLCVDDESSHVAAGEMVLALTSLVSSFANLGA